MKNTSQKITGNTALMLDNLKHEALTKLRKRISKTRLFELIMNKIMNDERCKKEFWKHLKKYEGR